MMISPWCVVELDDLVLCVRDHGPAFAGLGWPARFEVAIVDAGAIVGGLWHDGANAVARQGAKLNRGAWLRIDRALWISLEQWRRDVAAAVAAE